MGRLAIGFSLVPLAACEVNTVTPLGRGQTLPFQTPIPDFYVINGGRDAVEGWPGVPSLSRADWTLTVDGLVDRPLSLSFDDLTSADVPEVSVLMTMRCVSDPSPNVQPDDLLFVGTAIWSGVRLRDVLEEAGIDREATNRLHLFAEDGYNNNLPLRRIYGPDAAPGPILAYRMNGEPLPEEHGFPVRVIAPGLYGYKNVKWLSRIEATTDDSVFGQYQRRLGFVDDADVRVTSRVADPFQGTTVPAGEALRMQGYALSGYAGVETVEVAVDDGPFRPAAIQSRDAVADGYPDVQQTVQWQETSRFTYPFPGVWAIWTREVTLSRGTHVLRVRATDRAGNRQPPTDDDPTDGSNSVLQIEVTAT